MNTPKVPPLNTCFAYYNKFIDPDALITENSTIEFILTSLLNNGDVVALIICTEEITSLLFKANINPGYVDDKRDYQTDMTLAHKLFYYNLVLKKKLDPQKQIDNYNMLISKDLSIIKNRKKELYKNRKIVIQMKNLFEILFLKKSSNIDYHS
jgi:hypothetical protein